MRCCQDAIKAIKEGMVFPCAIESIVKTIEPVVVKEKKEPGDLLQNSILENVRMGVAKLNSSDPVIASFVKEGKVKVVGGNYDLETGEVILGALSFCLNSLRVQLWAFAKAVDS
jgi:carbonic anhydrase